jgi:hypothetical protein
VTDSLFFYPPHRLGLIAQIAAILIALSLGIFGLWRASQAPIGLEFLLYLLPVLLAFILVPLIGYRTYAQWRAYYLLERTWVRSERDLDTSLPRPRVRWPGAVLGVRKLPDGTRVEYLAAHSSQLILISAGDRIFAISPSNPEEFMHTYHRFAELGSLTPPAAYSVYPANLLRRNMGLSVCQVLTFSWVAGLRPFTGCG